MAAAIAVPEESGTLATDTNMPVPTVTNIRYQSTSAYPNYEEELSECLQEQFEDEDLACINGNGTLSDGDYCTNRVKRQRRPKQPGHRKAAPTCPLPASGASSPDSNRSSLSAKSDNTPSGAVHASSSIQVMRTGKWSDEEQKRFLDGLETFGRDWHAIARYIGTRPVTLIRARASRYFARLYLASKPLPAKVRESGHGYTVSGKPLLSSSPTLTSIYRGAIDPSTLPSQDGASPLVVVPTIKREQAKGKLKGRPYVEFKVPKPQSKRKRSVSPHDNPIGADGRTDYVRNRPRREATKKKRQYAEDEYHLLPCPRFRNSPGDGQLGSQPYQLQVERTAIAVVDLHSHLLDTEVVGLLAGTFDAEQKLCTIKTAFPAQRKVIDADTSITVEESLAEALSLADSLGMQIMGWYHSHPVFHTNPSQMDVQTQHVHQKAFGGYHQDDDRTQAGEQKDWKPFLGAICGPYHQALPSSTSDFTWFILPDASKPLPRSLDYVLLGLERIKTEGLSRKDFNSMIDLIRSFKIDRHDEERVDFTEKWKKKQLRVEKCVRSLRSWLTDFEDPSTEEIQPKASNHFIPVEYALERIADELQNFKCASANYDNGANAQLSSSGSGDDAGIGLNSV
ncbi:hypothetical protein BC832DRAFT_595072 [Gaertneriomyces semiglobifer]|nr:hypothetical protein BC832DRAFT_595072 [Gaertneriomyces semiglobifer]